MQQAVLCGKRYQKSTFSGVYASPLLRARRTAELILGQMETAHQLVLEDALRERCFGDWEGMLWSDIQQQYPQLIESSKTDGDFVIPGGGESRHQCVERALGFLEELAASCPEDAHVLCVTHSGVATAIIKAVLGLPQGARRSFDIRNLAINQLHHTADGWMVRSLGDTTHLDRPPGSGSFGAGAGTSSAAGVGGGAASVDASALPRSRGGRANDPGVEVVRHPWEDAERFPPPGCF